MATSNTLHIVNYFPQDITVHVASRGWNCCDTPHIGDSVFIKTNEQALMDYVRRNGHGCDDVPGRFTLVINSNYSIEMNFDGHGDMGSINPSGGFGAWVGRNSNSDPSWALIVGPLPGGAR
ncbi:MAG TPA: hypothetical protein VFQ67_03185 [Allosphingosinicella sp.]|jgi:hypothetical protein|nr:hypothetical protein [Allosphingosinicella sp.]